MVFYENTYIVSECMAWPAEKAYGTEAAPMQRSMRQFLALFNGSSSA